MDVLSIEIRTINQQCAMRIIIKLKLLCKNRSCKSSCCNTRIYIGILPYVPFCQVLHVIFPSFCRINFGICYKTLEISHVLYTPFYINVELCLQRIVHALMIRPLAIILVRVTSFKASRVCRRRVARVRRRWRRWTQRRTVEQRRPRHFRRRRADAGTAADVRARARALQRQQRFSRRVGIRQHLATRDDETGSDVGVHRLHLQRMRRRGRVVRLPEWHPRSDSHEVAVRNIR